MLLASYGQLPAMLCVSVAGMLLIKISKGQKKIVVSFELSIWDLVQYFCNYGDYNGSNVIYSSYVYCFKCHDCSDYCWCY